MLMIWVLTTSPAAGRDLTLDQVVWISGTKKVLSIRRRLHLLTSHCFTGILPQHFHLIQPLLLFNHAVKLHLFTPSVPENRIYNRTILLWKSSDAFAASLLHICSFLFYSFLLFLLFILFHLFAMRLKPLLVRGLPLLAAPPSCTHRSPILNLRNSLWSCYVMITCLFLVWGQKQTNSGPHGTLKEEVGSRLSGTSNRCSPEPRPHLPGFQEFKDARRPGNTT